VTSDGGLFTWGANDAGQLGVGEFNEHREKPGRVQGAVEREQVMRVACGAAHLIALARSGAVFGVGDGTSGQLGKGDRERRRYISALSHLSGVAVRGVACGARHTVFLTVEGTVLTCGANDFGQLGVATRFGAAAHYASPTHSLIEPLIPGAEYGGSPTGTLSQVPSLVNTPTPVRSLRGRAICHVECGANHSIAIADDGSVFVWGSNHFGQLGLPSNDKIVGAPTLLVAVKPDRILAAAGGVRHSLFVTTRGTVRSFGQGSAGQLGRPTSDADHNFVIGFDGSKAASRSQRTRTTSLRVRSGRCRSIAAAV
jgi:alpha-tubulin suppressor-like RCC1 family protein